MHFNKHGSKSSCDPKNVHSWENNHQSHVGRELLILVMKIKGFINDRCLLFLSTIGLFRYKFNSRLANDYANPNKRQTPQSEEKLSYYFVFRHSLLARIP